MNEVWSTDTCPFCVKAKELLDNYGFKYIEYNVNENKEQFKEKFPNAKTVPQIIFNNEHVGGYTDLVETFENQNIFIGGQSIV